MKILFGSYYFFYKTDYVSNKKKKPITDLKKKTRLYLSFTYHVIIESLVNIASHLLI